MKLLGTKTSPYTRKIRILLNAIAEPYTLLDTRFGAGAEELAAVAPLGKVPVLVAADPPLVIPDSALIIEWLWANRASALRTAGFDLERTAWDDRVFAVLVDGAVDAAINRRYLGLEGAADAGYVLKQKQRFERTLSAVDERAKFVRPVRLGTLALGCALDWIAFRSVTDLTRWPRISAFRDEWNAAGVGTGTEPEE